MPSNRWGFVSARDVSARRDLLVVIGVATASLLLYTITAAPSVATLFDDSLELQVVLPTLGIAHPSGYPLYTLLGKLFTLTLPFRDPAGRANLFSALAAAMAVGILYLVAQRIAISRVAAAVVALAFAISPTWWSQATIAEVYALHGLLVLCFIYCLLRWAETGRRPRSTQLKAGRPTDSNIQTPASTPAPPKSETLAPALRSGASAGVRNPKSAGGSPTSNDAWLSAAVLTFSLGLAHHRTIALLAPAALVFVLLTDPRFLHRPRRWLRLVPLGLAPLLLYLYLPIRGQAVTSLDGTFKPTLHGTVDWVLARGYKVFLTDNPFGVSRDLGFFVRLFLDQFGVLLILAAVLGLATAWRLWPRRYAFLLLATVAQVAFGVAYKAEDVEVFFIPAFILAGLWAALGLVYAFGLVIRWSGRLPWGAIPLWAWLPLWDLATLLAVVLLLFQPARTAVHDFPQRDRSRAWEVYDYGQDMLASIAPGGKVVGLLGETTLLRYFRDVLGERPDITVVAADAEAARFAAVDRALAAGVPVYLTRDLPAASARYSLDAVGPLIAVSPKATPAPIPSGHQVGAGILLVAASSEVRQPHAGPVMRLTLTWAAAEPVSEELKVSARLLEQDGQVVAQDDRVPAHFTYPTTAWVPGELVQDVYDLALPPDRVEGSSSAPFDSYRVLLILYRGVDGGEVGRVELPMAVTLL